MSSGGIMAGPFSAVAASAVSAYRRVRLDSSGQIAHAGKEPADGVTLQAGAVGELTPVKLFSQGGTFEIEANEAVAKGATLYPADAGRVADTKAEGGQQFRTLDAAIAQGDVIEVALINAETSELVYSNVADSATITNTIAETDFDKTFTFDGSKLQAGDVLEIDAFVNMPSTNATDTLTLKLYLGTEVLLATAAVDVANNDVGHIRFLAVIRAAGAGGSVAGFGSYSLGGAGTLKTSVRKAASAEDLSGNAVIKLSAQWSVANAGNQCDLEHLIVKRHRAAA